VFTRLDPSQYKRTPWKNGGGETVDIAANDAWRFGRTPIVASGPFSDYTGFDRIQVLVAGKGLVLETPDGEIDVRTPFQPVRFDGETPVTSRLEDGPVEVVNLIGRRDVVSIDMGVLTLGRTLTISPGFHYVYAPEGSSAFTCAGASHALTHDHALRIEAGQRTIIAATSGRLLVASVYPV
jgi:environmental stress-induced protein Ves